MDVAIGNLYTDVKMFGKSNLDSIWKEIRLLTVLKINSELSRGMHTKKNLNKSGETDHPRSLKSDTFLFFEAFWL